jgi:MYXO-CTERM domain-containing protein
VNATGLCANDPCEHVHCGKGQVCVVGDDGSPDCAIQAATGIAIQTHAEGSGVVGCSCSLAGAAPEGRRGWLEAFVVMAAAGILLRRRRRERARLR